MGSYWVLTLGILAGALPLAPWSPAAAEHGTQPGQVLNLSVTESGFAPASLVVQKDEPVTLVVTRRTDATCATEIVIPEYGIRAKLPLNRPVKVTFTPQRMGEIEYTCGMGMIGGVLSVE